MYARVRANVLLHRYIENVSWKRQEEKYERKRKETNIVQRGKRIFRKTLYSNNNNMNYDRRVTVEVSLMAFGGFICCGYYVIFIFYFFMSTNTL